MFSCFNKDTRRARKYLERFNLHSKGSIYIQVIFNGNEPTKSDRESNVY